MTAQVPREVADADLSRPALLWQRRREAVGAPCHGIVTLVQREVPLRINVEEQQQVEQLFEAVGQFRVARRLEFVSLQAVEVAIEPSEIASTLTGLERHYSERECVGTRGLEAVKCLQPAVDPSGAEQRLGERLVRGDVPRIARKNVLERADRSRCATLLAKDHADVEVGRDQLRRERQRSLISAQRETAPMQHLERHTLVVMRLAVRRRQLECVLERLPSRASAALRKPRLSERAPQ